MKNIIKSRPKNYKSIIGMIILGLIIVSFSGVMVYRTINNRKLEELKELGIEKFQDKQYTAAEEVLNNYIQKGGESKEISGVLKIIDVYEKSIKLFEQGEYDKAEEELNQIPSTYLRYKIVDDVQDLQKEIEKNKIDEEDFSKSDKSIKLSNYISDKIEANVKEIITVVRRSGVRAELILWEKKDEGWVQKDRMLARLGLNGMKDASEVYEGDKCTPTGMYTLTRGFGHEDNPGTKMPYRVLDGSEYWVDDPSSKYYNTMQFGEPNGRWNSAENLSEVGMAYDYAMVINYNMNPIVPGKSSAIFLHVDNGFPTQGCVAVREKKMIEILRWLNPQDNPIIVIAKNYDQLKTDL